MTVIPEKYNVSTLLDANLDAGRGDKVAFVCRDHKMSYSELLGRVCRLGRALRRLGVRSGDRVMLILGDTLAFPVAFFGALRIGAVPCPTNPLLKEADYRSFIEDAGASVVITDAMYVEKVIRSLADYSGVRTIIAPVTTTGRIISMDDMLSGEEDMLPPADTHRDDMAFWLYSGGSTGRPKAVIHTHQDIPWTCETYGRHVLGIQESDVFFARVLFHAYGLGGALSFPLWAGATSVLYPDRPYAADLLRYIELHKPSLLFLVPTLYSAILTELSSSSVDLSSLRCCISAAEPLPLETWLRWYNKFGLPILDGIGSTEMLHIFCSNTPHAMRPGSSGKPVPGYELRLVDEAGTPISAGDSGILQVRGQSASVGYWRQRAKTQSTMIGEWIATGDRYRRDRDGFYWYEGRVDDMIKIGGEWVSPIQVESVLRQHAAVSEVAVIGVSVENVMRIRARLVLAPGFVASEKLVHELQEWCKSRLQRYQYPHLIEFARDLPKTTVGKIQRSVLRDGICELGARVDGTSAPVQDH
jgi:benzoate-CoA ligase family protein